MHKDTPFFLQRKAGEKVFLACPVYTFINNIVYYLHGIFDAGNNNGEFFVDRMLRY